MKNSTKTADSTQTDAPQKAQSAGRSKPLNFSDPHERDAHIAAFLAWLPKVLHEAPNIDWSRLPSSVMGYLLYNMRENPDSIPITLAVGCMMHAVKRRSLHTYCSQLTNLLRRLRTRYEMKDLVQLRERAIWDRFVEERTITQSAVRMLMIYETLASIHLRTYLEDLPERQRLFWEQFALPQLPANFTVKHGLYRADQALAQARRKEQSDVLTPLFPLLVEIAQLRKQAAERLIKEFRKERDRALAGEITLPYHFQYTDRQISVSEDASLVSEVALVEREVTLQFSLWDKYTWVRDHLEHYSSGSRKNWRRGVRAYAPEYNTCFLQYEGDPADLLWCGKLIATRRLGTTPYSSLPQTEEVADGDDEPTGFRISRAGLLSPVNGDSQWLRKAMSFGDVLFEPESFYRGCLYASALATLALTNGSRVSEILQVSATRFETLVVDELKNQQPTGRKIGILVQNLLPKGSTQESERQFFLISEVAGRLLAEIGQLLETTHGGSIPIVHPYKNTKEEDLFPEPYLFQWAASPDGRLGLLNAVEVGELLRFLFYGLTFTTRAGKPIRVVPHLLRHILATHARTVQKVPAEAVAYLLHHRVTLQSSTRALSIPEATAYYSRLPLERLLALLFEAQSQLSSHRTSSYLQVPSPRTMEQMEETLRQIFEQWSMIGPTVFGYCGAGLCIRPNNRALCLNCPHLVPHYSNLRNAKTWRRFYVLQAQLHDAHGHHVDAKQARQMIQYLDDIMNVMQIQIRARQDGGHLPFADTLLQMLDDEGDLS